MNPFEILNDVKVRAAEAIIAQSGLSHPHLAKHLREIFTSDDPKKGALLGEPVLEGVHPFELGEPSMEGLSGKLLHPDLVNALDGGVHVGASGYRFPRDRKPFRHQLQAWESLINNKEAQSVLVTSGTGSGKTECFLIPLLNDLVTQLDPAISTLTGVQAIMLYPLNALIESQKERLSAWTSPFAGKIRFCLYNGDLNYAMDADTKRETPEQVLDRETLRKSPPPILVTNKTMLEYMLARYEDAPILTQSKGKLRWIILDEAHSLVGAAAAEVALLLRRVLLAFGVDPINVRFVATSATIGSGPEVAKHLKKFLAELAGIDDANVRVVEGFRRMPPRPNPGIVESLPQQIRSFDKERLYRAFASKPEVWTLVERLFHGAVRVPEVASIANRIGYSTEDFIYGLTTARVSETSTKMEEILAPVRLHAFERAVPGLWSCINPSCADSITGWQFGAILTERAECCTHCDAPVLELLVCSLCGEVILEGEESEGRLTPPLRTPPRDEFQFEVEAEDAGHEDDDEDENVKVESAAISRYFATSPTKAARPFYLHKENWAVLDTADPAALVLRVDDAADRRICPCCAQTSRKGNPLRPVRFGAPSLIGNTAPILLEGVDPSIGLEETERMPFDGRQLLSFTDSRQGTARLSAKIQTEAERNFVRSVVYHTVQSGLLVSPANLTEAIKYQEQIETLEKLVQHNPVLEGPLADARLKLSLLQNGNSIGLKWEDMVNRLSERLEVSHWLKQVWAERDESFEDTGKLAEFMLLREFTRRPRSGNSIETLGFAKLTFPTIERLTERDLPKINSNLSLGDWKAFLYHCLTHYVRANRVIGIPNDLQIWIQPKLGLRYLIPGDASLRRTGQTLPWPSVPPSGARSRVVSLLMAGLGYTLTSPSDLADINECLSKAWAALLPVLTWEGSANHVVAFNKGMIAPITDCHFCPVTKRILDHASFGLSPYGLSLKGAPPKAIAIQMPRHPLPIPEQYYTPESKRRIKEWLAADSEVLKLRTYGAWNNISDRIALFADYARSAEHSAQQPSSLLRRYEKSFKLGQINILNCSTTMEMGVDIGSVAAVMMTNVPPSIASYRQRVGRAGRRGQPISLAFTFCKDRALDREAFRDPATYLKRNVGVPSVALTSIPIIQRHVNAYLLGEFIRENAGDSLKMSIGGFLGCPETADQVRLPSQQRPVAAFVEWLRRPSVRAARQFAVDTITSKSVLERDPNLFETTFENILILEKEFCDVWEGLRQQVLEEPMSSGGKSRLAVEIRRMTGEFLLGSLAERGFLPGHGFPTHVVSFLTNAIAAKVQQNDRGENPWRSERGPKRPLDLAIRDYAPGSEIVLDGLVHKSAGITLNWKRPASVEGVPEIQSLRCQWTCNACGTSDTASSRPPGSCPSCGATSIDSIDFIRPAGFMADSRDKPHAQIDEIDYVQAEDPRASARDENWISLSLPKNGRYRTSRQGLVFYSSKGAKRNGYAVCLHCGRAEAEEWAPGIHSDALKNHAPLRRTRGEGADHCAGNEEPWKIRHHLALGHEIQTDVFELQPTAQISRPAATALIIAIREALSQELGIEAEELGYALEERLNSLQATVISLYLYDNAAGGAGFAVEAGSRLSDVLIGAERILDCVTPGCEHACSACVLTRDAPDAPGSLNRKDALQFLRHHLRLSEDLPVTDKFIPAAVQSESVMDEIDRMIRDTNSATLNVYLPFDQSSYDLSSFRLAPQLFDLAYRKRNASIVIPRALFAAADAAQRLAFKDFILKHHLKPVEGNAPKFENGSVAIASIVSNGAPATVWTTTEIPPRSPNAQWGLPQKRPIARGEVFINETSRPMEVREFDVPTGVQFVEIRNELNGPAEVFGKVAATIMVNALKKASAWSTCRISSIFYEDRYVRSPLVLKLLVDTVDQLFKASGAQQGELVVKTGGVGSSDHRSPFRIEHDWTELQTRTEVAAAYGSALGVKVKLIQSEASHSRTMQIVFEDGNKSRIVLDQGFGAWNLPTSKSVRHDFGGSPDIQVKALRQLKETLHFRGVNATYFVALKET